MILKVLENPNSRIGFRNTDIESLTVVPQTTMNEAVNAETQKEIMKTYS